MNSHSNDILISTGQWSKEICWEFYLSSSVPTENLVTAVCCVVIYEQKIVIIRNRRGWELPGGKIKDNETPLEAIAREVQEETGFFITNLKNIGYKKIIPTSPVSNSEKPGTYYPFPYSFVLFFLSEAIKTANKKPTDEILEIKLAAYNEAIALLEAGRQYDGILNILLKNHLIDGSLY